MLVEKPIMDIHLPESMVSSESDEHQILEHYLMLCARTSRVKILHAWHVGLRQPQELLHHGKQRLYCWVDANNLDPNNDLQDVVRRGFRIPSEGMTFAFGCLVLPGLPIFLNYNDISKMQDGFPVGERRTFHFILCEVVTGLGAPAKRTYKFSQFDSIVRTISPLGTNVKNLSALRSAGLHNYTLHFPRGGPLIGSSATVGVLPKISITEEYTVFDMSQVIPRFVVLVESNPLWLEKFAIPLCDNCAELPSAVWCKADKAKLCDTCDQHIHQKSQLVLRHSRVQLHHRPRGHGKCLFHPNEEPDLFCCVCSIPVCRLCISLHAHQASDFSGLDSEDFLIPVSHPAKTIKFAERFEFPIIEEARNIADRRLAIIEGRRKKLAYELSEVETKILDELDGALQQLSHQVQQKMVLLVGGTSQAKRQLNEIVYGEEFLKYLHSVLPPADYLQFWLRHKRYQRKLEEDGESNETSKGRPLSFADLQISGGLKIRFGQS